MITPATVVDTDALVETVLGAAIAGVGTTFVVSIAILGSIRFADANREGRSVEAAIYGGLVALSLLVVVAGVVVGVVVMTSK